MALGTLGAAAKKDCIYNRPGIRSRLPLSPSFLKWELLWKEVPPRGHTAPWERVFSNRKENIDLHSARQFPGQSQTCRALWGSEFTTKALPSDVPVSRSWVRKRRHHRGVWELLLSNLGLLLSWPVLKCYRHLFPAAWWKWAADIALNQVAQERCSKM